MTQDACTLHPLLLQAPFWRERLEHLQTVPRQLLVFPRADLSWPGGEVCEIWLRAHDGVRLRALIGHSLMPAPRPRLRLSLIDPARPNPVFDWDRIRDGEVQALFVRPEPRRLEDRVLDLVRVAGAARDLSGLDTPRTELEGEALDEERDEFRIARQLFDEGWV